MKTRKILLIMLTMVIILSAGIISYAMLFNENYQVVQVSQSASLKIPVGNGINSIELSGYIHKFSNNKNVEIYSYNSNDISLGGAITFSEMKTRAVGNPHNDNQIIEHQENGKTVYSITYGNSNTHDNIIITTTSRELTQKIFDSIRITNSTNNTTNTSDNLKKSDNLDNTKKANNPDNTKKADNTKTPEEIKKDEYAKLKEYNDAYHAGYDAGVADSEYYYENQYYPEPTGGGSDNGDSGMMV